MILKKRNLAVSIAAVLCSFSLIISTSPLHARAFAIKRKVSTGIDIMRNTDSTSLLKMTNIWDEADLDTSNLKISLKKITVEPAVEGKTKSEKTVLTDRDYDALCRIVQAEAGHEDYKGKVLVANVVLNRYKSSIFPNTVYDVVTQTHYGSNGLVYQFSPAKPGCSFWYVSPSEETIKAVNKALNGTDYSQGALYFVARDKADPGNVSWFDRNLTKLFKHGNHEFFA